ncbi:B12-binding domain-containing radical SAM protein [Streptomyces sp. NPDC007264]|uniref:B12-binding domain-containing radical SAM protein n=1 Tax=Streptomyces sp. NPDC007264 TaxID=3364777 RepID=UPI0036DF1C2D
MDEVDVVLLAPPYYRFCGSHNNRAAPSLTYLSAFLEEAGISHVVYNADHTPGRRFWSMKWMFQNYQPFVDAVDGRGSLYGEVAEIVMSFNPKAVVILGGEPLIATKDWGNPFIAAHYSTLLRRLGVYTVGVGHFFTLDRQRFQDDFDCVLGGEPSEQIVDILRERRTGYVPPRPIPLTTLPNLGRLFPADQQTDFVMTSFGCRFPCSFCLVQQFYGELDERVRFVDLDTAVADIAQRPEQGVYLTDLTFTYAPRKRLAALTEALREAGVHKSYTIDTRVDMITPQIADQLAELGVERVKIGVEGITRDLLKSFNKRTDLRKIERAVGLLRERGIKVVTYLLIGGVTELADYEATRDYIATLQPEFVPVAVWAYDLSGDYRYDTQFSPLRLKEWGIDEEVFHRYLSLQEQVNPTVGAMLDVL